MIRISCPSDIAPLREVVVGPVKKFGWWDLIRGGLKDLDSVGIHQLKNNRVQIPRYPIALRQHSEFVATLRNNGVIVHTVDILDDVPIQLYTRDIAFAIEDTLFLARSRHPERRREQDGIKRLLPQLSRVQVLDDGIIEGGDVIVTDTEVLVGMGEESNQKGVAALRRGLERSGIDREVIPIEFATRGVVHLDTKFTMVGPRLGLFYPPAFTAESRRQLEIRFELIEATKNDALTLSVNTVALAPDKIIIDHRSERLAATLRRHGVTPVPVDYSEITKFPGGFRCATLPLVRG